MEWSREADRGDVRAWGAGARRRWQQLRVGGSTADPASPARGSHADAANTGTKRTARAHS